MPDAVGEQNGQAEQDQRGDDHHDRRAGLTLQIKLYAGLQASHNGPRTPARKASWAARSAGLATMGRGVLARTGW